MTLWLISRDAVGESPGAEYLDMDSGVYDHRRDVSLDIDNIRLEVPSFYEPYNNPYNPQG